MVKIHVVVAAVSVMFAGRVGLIFVELLLRSNNNFHRARVTVVQLSDGCWENIL